MVASAVTLEPETVIESHDLRGRGARIAKALFTQSYPHKLTHVQHPLAHKTTATTSYVSRIYPQTAAPFQAMTALPS